MKKLVWVMVLVVLMTMVTMASALAGTKVCDRCGGSNVRCITYNEYEHDLFCNKCDGSDWWITTEAHTMNGSFCSSCGYCGCMHTNMAFIDLANHGNPGYHAYACPTCFTGIAWAEPHEMIDGRCMACGAVDSRYVPTIEPQQSVAEPEPEEMPIQQQDMLYENEPVVYEGRQAEMPSGCVNHHYSYTAEGSGMHTAYCYACAESKQGWCVMNDSNSCILCGFHVDMLMLPSEEEAQQAINSRKPVVIVRKTNKEGQFALAMYEYGARAKLTYTVTVDLPVNGLIGTLTYNENGVEVPYPGEVTPNGLRIQTHDTGIYTFVCEEVTI